MARKQKHQLLQRSNPQEVEEEERRGKNSWPNLPTQLIKLIQRNPPLMHNMTFGGVSKSWRSKSSYCSNTSSSPAHSWLQLSDSSVPDRLIESFNITFPSMWYNYMGYYQKWRFDLNPWKCIIGYSQDVVIARGVHNNSNGLALWNPFEELWSVYLPPWDPAVPFKLVVISSPSTQWMYGINAMVLTGETHPAFVFCSFSQSTNSYKWVKQDCAILDSNSGDPNSKKHHKNYMYFTNAIGMKGKFYALSIQGTLAVLELVESRFTIIALCRQRAVPSIPSSHFKEYLVAFDGNVLVVFIIYRKLGGKCSASGVEVLRLKEEDKLSWVKMESLGDRAVFAGEDCCICGLASELECRSNSVYFTQKDDDEWWMYDLESGRISSSVASGKYNTIVYN